MTEVLTPHIPLKKLVVELTNRAEYSSCLKWSKVNHCWGMMEMSCWFVMFLGTGSCVCVYLFFIWIHTKILSLWNTTLLKDYLSHKSLCFSCSKEWKRLNKTCHCVGVAASYLLSTGAAEFHLQPSNTILLKVGYLNMLFGQVWCFMLNSLWNPVTCDSTLLGGKFS